MSATHYIGIMSGTSLDGVDAVLVDFTQSCPLEHTCYMPYDAALRAALLALNQRSEDELHRAAVLANRIARLYAESVRRLLDETGINPRQIVAIGCHGQTVRHYPQPENGYSIQLVNGALLAELTGIAVVTDFRSRDIAAGGQGAPLVPAFHQEVFAHSAIDRSIVNIGGIANITCLPVNGHVTGFDCGPGNILLDAWCARHLDTPYDRDGQWGVSGRVIPRLLENLQAFPYFSLPPPKSTGREMFNIDWLQSYLQGDEAAQDVQATLVALTATTITRAVSAYFPEADEIYLCGGGAHNGALVDQLRQGLPASDIKLTNALGIDADWVEACAFAWLAQRAIERAPGNLPDVTGANESRILGAIYPA
ncbi:MAG: anhydro-N-acetylmuramic acid kinase [Nitrosomonas halophila]